MPLVGVTTFTESPNELVMVVENDSCFHSSGPPPDAMLDHACMELLY